jgi:hypothetical protein
MILGVNTAEDLAAFIDALSADAVEHGSEWANLTIFDMLESMAAWLRDSAEEGADSPALRPVELRFVARLLLAGKHYE